jgi:hypothetical protein
MEKINLIELNSVELQEIEGGFIQAFVLYGGAALLAYELGHAVGTGIGNLIYK